MCLNKHWKVRVWRDTEWSQRNNTQSLGIIKSGCTLEGIFIRCHICRTIISLCHLEMRTICKICANRNLLMKSISIPAKFLSAKHFAAAAAAELMSQKRKKRRTQSDVYEKNHEFMTWMWCDCTVLISVHRMLTNKSFHFFFRHRRHRCRCCQCIKRERKKNKSGSFAENLK